MQITNQMGDQNNVPTAKGKGPNYLLPFILITLLFFLWGMAHNLDSILIPHLKKACNLNNSQSTLIDTSVFLAYFLMAIPAGMILKRFGYKASMITGLLVFACGAFLFVPAAKAKLIEGLMEIGLFKPDVNEKAKETNSDLSAIKFKDVNGNVVSLADLKGKIIFLN